MSRKPIIVGNWKMNKNNAETSAFIQGVDAHLHDHADFGIAAPYTSLYTAASEAKHLIVAAENVHFEASGAYTGEISVAMLQELNVQWVILGHSERRQYFNETDETVNKKTKAAIAGGLTPIVCVGETLEEFEAGKTEEVVRRQVAGALAGVEGLAVRELVIAYEPVWAIGTGKSATKEIAQNTCALVRDEVKVLYDESIAQSVRIQYGGSVKPDNIKEYMAEEDIDGALIGGASLKVDSFLEIIEAVK